MIAAFVPPWPALDDAQVRAVAHPRAAGSLAIRGDAGTGKTAALLARARRLAPQGPLWLTTPSDTGVARLQERLLLEGAVDELRCATFGDIAFDVLRAARPHERFDVIDDVHASQIFERVGGALFALEWTEILSAEIDPEITGLRAPERFAAAAFRLFRKLRAALISPEAFADASRRGATTFYGKPPNFADADLLAATPAKYRSALRVDPGELARQRAREIDLVKVLEGLYRSYTETLVARGCLTPTDAVFEAAVLLRAQPAVRAAAQQRFGALLIDDAHDLSAAQSALLEGLAQNALANATFAGDERQRTRSFAGGGRGVEHLRAAATTVWLTTGYRCAPAIARATRALSEPEPVSTPRHPAQALAPDASEALALQRFPEARDEARYVASEILRLRALGMPASRIAVVTRSLGCAGIYVDALLARDLPVDVAGAANLFALRAVGDALAALWSGVDPFRHDYLLRALQAPWLALCDASLAVLCAEAEEPLLFDLPEDDADRGQRRWDRRRDLRLARNVTRGDVDAELPAEARERLQAWRSAFGRWDALARTLTPAALAHAILADTVFATLRSDAHGRFERGLVMRLLDEIERVAARDPLAPLADVLADLERLAQTEDDLLAIAPRDGDAVAVRDVEAVKGAEFEAVFAVDVRAGAWPRYYAPDAFLFLPSLGMVPKENVGDVRVARTAKFTYALARYKLREKYDAEDRRALALALSRARTFASVSAAGRATRGTATPELLEELRRGQ